MQEMIAARVVEGSAYEEMVSGGFAPGYTFRCHACEVSASILVPSAARPQ
jgi:hypothetical protein